MEATTVSDRLAAANRRVAWLGILGGGLLLVVGAYAEERWTSVGHYSLEDGQTENLPELSIRVDGQSPTRPGGAHTVGRFDLSIDRRRCGLSNIAPGQNFVFSGCGDAKEYKITLSTIRSPAPKTWFDFSVEERRKITVISDPRLPIRSRDDASPVAEPSRPHDGVSPVAEPSEVPGPVDPPKPGPEPNGNGINPVIVAALITVVGGIVVALIRRGRAGED